MWAKMSSLSDLLRVRGVPEEAISLMEDQKFSETGMCCFCASSCTFVSYYGQTCHWIHRAIWNMLKENSGILHFEPPFWVVYNEIEWLTLTFWRLVLSWVFGSFRIAPACFRMAGYGHSQKSGVRWCSSLSIIAKYSFRRVLFGILFIPLISVGRLIARWPEMERAAVYVWL